MPKDTCLRKLLAWKFIILIIYKVVWWGENEKNEVVLTSATDQFVSFLHWPEKSPIRKWTNCLPHHRKNWSSERGGIIILENIYACGWFKTPNLTFSIKYIFWAIENIKWKTNFNLSFCYLRWIEFEFGHSSCFSTNRNWNLTRYCLKNKHTPN